MVSGNAAGYKLFWTGIEKGLGGVGILLAKKCADKVIDITKVSEPLGGEGVWCDFRKRSQFIKRVKISKLTNVP